MSFDWQDGESRWSDHPNEEPGPNPAAGGPPPPDESPPPAADKEWRGRRYLWLALAAVLLVGLGAIVGQLAGRQIDERAELLISEVEASYATILDAAGNRDGELFSTFLSGSEPEWVVAQQVLASRGLFLDRSAFGLTLEGDPAALGDTPPTITLSPDLLSAELSRPVTYTVDIGNALTETVTLEQTVVFRRGEDRWLYAPPEADFWGATLTDRGRYLTISYPERDATVGRRLARELDAKLIEYCATPQIGGCPADLEMEIVLSTDPSTIVAASDLLGRWQLNDPVQLPAPSLAGVPEDEAAYRALYRGYASQLIAALAGDLAGWRCCDSGLYYSTLLAAQLRKLGLRPWPLTPADYARFAENPEELDNLEALWRGSTIDSPPENVWQPYVLVEFLTEEIGAMPILMMQRMLMSNPNQDYWTWLSQVTGDRYGTQQDFERDLLRFAASRAPERPSAAAAPPVVQKPYPPPAGGSPHLPFSRVKGS